MSDHVEVFKRIAEIENLLLETRKLLDQTGLSERERITLTQRADGMVSTALDRLAKISVDVAITVEAIEPIFDVTQRTNMEIKLIDLCYNVFMHGRNAQPREDGNDRVDWFTDTQPWVKGVVERMKVETIRRMEYARGDYGTRNRIHHEMNA